MTTRQTGGLLWGYKPLLLASVSRRWLSQFVQATLVLSLLPSLKRRLYHSLTLKRVFIFSNTQLIQSNIMLFLILNVLLDGRLVKSYCTYVASFYPKVPVTILIFQLCMFIRLLLPLRYP